MLKLTARTNTLILKCWRDLWQQRIRTLLVIIAIALSAFVLGVVLSSYAILEREMNQNFLAANPTDISLTTSESIDIVTREKLEMMKAIEAVEIRTQAGGVVQNTYGKEFNLRIFIVNNFAQQQVDLITLSQGSWPVEPGEILIEQQAIGLLRASVGDTILLSDNQQLEGNVKIIGSAHDVVRAQAEWENIVYAYMTQETFNQLGGSAPQQQQLIRLKDRKLTRQQRELLAIDYKNMLQESSYEVTDVNVSTVGKHPHANITSGMFMIQKVFAYLCVLLSAILVFNLVSATLIKQRKHIAVMKAIGAQPRHIAIMVFSTVIIMGLIGLILSIPASIISTKLYVDTIAIMMNIDITSYTIPIWIFILQFTICLCVPILTSTLPILKASRSSIRKSLLPYTATQLNIKETSLWIRFSTCLPLSTTLRLSMRNLLRSKTRFLFTALVLTLGGAVLISTFNISSSMRYAVEKDRESKHWDYAIRLNQSYSEQEIKHGASKYDATHTVETFYQGQARIFGSDIIMPHKFNLMAINIKSNALKLKLLKGESLNNSGVVINQQAFKLLKNTGIGDTLIFNDGNTRYREKLIGVVESIGPATVFMARSSRITQEQNGLFVDFNGTGDPHDQLDTMERGLNENNIQIKRSISVGASSKIIEDHFEILFALMMLLSVILLMISSNGLMLMMSTNTLERRREFAVYKALGATKSSTYLILFYESMVLVFCSWICAGLVSLPISFLVCSTLGMLLIGSPFALNTTSEVYGLLFPMMIVLAGVSVFFPMRELHGNTVHTSLDQE
ncbi:MAG: putative ABC transport system permease protein [Flavobacteriales bacterium]|jgi:putative ABC transport system permease protein